MPQVAQHYSLIFKIFFWLLWLGGVGVFLVFAWFSSMTMGEGGFGEGASLIGPWNLLITVAEGAVLFISAVLFGNRDKSASVLFLWVLLATVVIPLIGFGGCVIQ
jgi:hypothetical protein